MVWVSSDYQDIIQHEIPQLTALDILLFPFAVLGVEESFVIYTYTYISRKYFNCIKLNKKTVD